MVGSPDGREDESIWEPTFCELPLFTTPHTLAAGQMSPVNTCYYISILVCLIPLQKFQWPAIMIAPIFFSGYWICLLCWQLGCFDYPKQSIFHVHTISGNPGAEQGNVDRCLKIGGALTGWALHTG